MRYAVTADGARVAEERVVAEGEVSLADLMRRAGEAVAREVERRAEGDAPVVIVCGRGNNGGDGWVAARALVANGYDVRVVTAEAPGHIPGIAGDAAREADAAGVPVQVVGDAPLAPDALKDAAVVVDALFGVGFSGEVREPFGSWTAAINASAASVIAVDIPSGVDASSGAVARDVVNAGATVTFSSPKLGCVLYPGAAYTGELLVADIGIPEEHLGSAGDPEIWAADDYAHVLPRPEPEAHKNTRGRVLVVAGSGAFPGAAALAAMGAQRAGAGYVTVAVPESVVQVLQSLMPSAIVMGLPENPSRTLASRVTGDVLDIAREFDSVVLGPGMTVAHGAVGVARALVSAVEAPLVVDADGLNALVDSVEMLTSRVSPTVITPHPGELSRLLGISPAEVQSDRLSYGRVLSGEQMACVLKGAHTVVSGAGRQVVTLAGNPGLATAGTGDVLAGVIGALLAQGLGPLDAGVLGAYLHARAGDHASAALTALSVVAEDIPAFLPEAIGELECVG